MIILKNDIYRSAVDHLKFSDDLYENVMKAAAPRPKFRFLRVAALSAAICALLVTSAFAMEGELRNWLFGVKELGTVEPDLSDAEEFAFTESIDTPGVELHYLNMGSGTGYSFHYGILYTKSGDFYRVTEDYQLKALEVRRMSAQLTKGERVYFQEFDYTVTDTGVLAPKAAVYMLPDGKTLAMVWSEDHHCWPVYFDPESNTIQDALPELNPDSFEGRICYAQPYRDGLLITTIAGENDQGAEVNYNGSDPCYNLLYHVSGDYTEATVIGKFSGGNYETFYCENDSIYYKSMEKDHLWLMDDNGEFQPVTDIKTTDDLTMGLMTAWNASGNLVVTDVVKGETYEIGGLNNTDKELYETTGYNASRHSYDGHIIITYSYTDWEAHNRPLTQIGLLDQQTGQLKLLECQTDYGIHAYGWLDDDRFAVIYEDGSRNYLCVYEFTA